MPKIPRTPQQPPEPREGPCSADKQEQTPGTPASANHQATPAPNLEALLLAMEGRLSSKMDTTNQKVDKALNLAAETNNALEELESKVADSEEAIQEQLTRVVTRLQDNIEKTEERLHTHFKTQVKTMVHDQLRSAGFDLDLTAGALSTINQTNNTYASVTAHRPEGAENSSGNNPKTRQERQEEKFWLGEFQIRKSHERRPKNKDKVVVTFEDKGIRDMIKANAHNLANYREEAGMRLHIPDHLQKTFKNLMALSYDMKKKQPELKRSVKFDEDKLNLYVYGCSGWP